MPYSDINLEDSRTITELSLRADAARHMQAGLSDAASNPTACTRSPSKMGRDDGVDMSRGDTHGMHQQPAYSPGDTGCLTGTLWAIRLLFSAVLQTDDGAATCEQLLYSAAHAPWEGLGRSGRYNAAGRHIMVAYSAHPVPSKLFPPMLHITPRGIIAAYAILSAANIAFILYLFHMLKSLVPAEREYTYVGDDFPAQLPLKLPAVGLVLSSDASHFSLYADDDWGSLFPLSDGFSTLHPAVLHPHPHQQQAPNSPSNGRTFLISMVHQLHCLDVLRVAFVANRTGAPQHVAHCLRYLRQAVLCHADATLEPDEPGVRDGRWEHAASGVGAVHRCRDWTALRRYLDEHPAEPVGM
ncbi:hypothetical protein NUW54_g5155 [Trametes sanguinea]|uniref:Uncharacterized protein n=1 Tax=Trametes sanguinea TaxID=158606 RepID=A0ACC1PVX5_9APHY|nr:hypothetical protein NUW54_g5155 [Trametes sanguinea]